MNFLVYRNIFFLFPIYQLIKTISIFSGSALTLPVYCALLRLWKNPIQSSFKTKDIPQIIKFIIKRKRIKLAPDICHCQ